MKKKKEKYLTGMKYKYNPPCRPYAPRSIPELPHELPNLILESFKLANCVDPLLLRELLLVGSLLGYYAPYDGDVLAGTGLLYGSDDVAALPVVVVEGGGGGGGGGAGVERGTVQ